MNIAIVEDEAVFQQQLSALIRNWNQEHGLELILKCFSSCQQFLNNFNQDYDGIFFDIMLPEENGMEAAKEIRQMDRDVPIVFVTSLMDYALEGYDLEALFYLIKPATQPDVDKCMNKMFGVNANFEYVAKLTNNQTARIKYSTITHLESQGHYIIINTLSGQHLCRKKLAEVMAELPEIFVQCHRSVLVNINHVSLISPQEIALTNGMAIPISNTYRDMVVRKFIECSQGRLSIRR